MIFLYYDVFFNFLKFNLIGSDGNNNEFFGFVSINILLNILLEIILF